MAWSKIFAIIGMIAGLASILLWYILVFQNPYDNTLQVDVAIRTLVMLFLPACLAIVAAAASMRMLMLVAFAWSLPVSLYLAMTPGIFVAFGATSLLYLVSFFGLRGRRQGGAVS